MPSQNPCFTLFKQQHLVNQHLSKAGFAEKFTFPFYYQPHPLCKLAAEELQSYLLSQTLWQHNFGNVEQNFSGDKPGAIGKMFGVLLVENQDSEIGYLSAFSGKLAEQNILPKFVPPVFDMLTKDSFFQIEQRIINQLNDKVDNLANNPDIAVLEQNIAVEQTQAELKFSAQRQININNRKTRKAKRAAAELAFNTSELNELALTLAKESVEDKKQLIALKEFWQEKLAFKQAKLAVLIDEVSLLKEQRKQLSINLQEKIFAQYRFLNSNGEVQNLTEIFSGTAFHQRYHQPPAGAGECAAPKLLQYAFVHNMKPLAMAEFWWGQAPKSAVRQHKNFYTSCIGKCKPILSHMLDGLSVDENPLLQNSASDKKLAIIYQDSDMLVVNKPAELLSVPGKEISDSVYSRIKQLYPQATGSLIVHRLDMSTSGLMVIALTKQAHKDLQKQFITRTVKKHYIAMLDGVLTETSGQINLPLAGDYDDRPRQLVCFESGKSAQTSWSVIENTEQAGTVQTDTVQIDNKAITTTRVLLIPKTGRTHQLRVHCAHINGLNMPIVGDDLYGKKADRLHLHAALLVLKHPVSQKLMTFEADAPF